MELLEALDRLDDGPARGRGVVPTLRARALAFERFIRLEEM
jgi:hypothetical protein